MQIGRDNQRLMNMDAAVNSFSLVELFMKADIIVKVVMIGLALTSVWSWAVTIDKYLMVRKLEAGARKVEQALAEGRTNDVIEDLSRQGDSTARIVSIGLAEARAARRNGNMTEAGAALAIERMERVMESQLSRELAKTERGLGVLATIGASATFIGLFGTVWGIMNSFRSIAASHDTNLAVVAPGIAEALFATAMGLVAAIPAVIFYNWISGSIDRFAARVETIVDDVIARASRRFVDGA